MARSPLRDGWRVLQRAPASVLAEIAWRWTFGLAFWATLYYGFREYFASVEITNAEYAAMRSLQPYTWMAICARIMVAFVEGLHIIGPIIIPALVILWIALATLGRSATIRALCHVDDGSALRSGGDIPTASINWVSTAALNFFRVILLFAALLAYFGCGILIDTLVDPTQHLGAVVLLAGLVLIAIVSIWGMLNWFLSLAPIFTVRDGAGIGRALSDAVDLYRARANAFTSSGFSFGVMRTVLAIVATILSLLPIAHFGGTHVRLTALIIVSVSLAYFVLADGLNVWRLAAYISFTEPEPAPPVITIPEPTPSILLPPEPSSAPQPPELPDPPTDSSEVPLSSVPPDSPLPGTNNQ